VVVPGERDVVNGGEPGVGRLVLRVEPGAGLGEMDRLVEEVAQPDGEWAGRVERAARDGEPDRARGGAEVQQQGGDGLGVQVEVVDRVGVRAAEEDAEVVAGEDGESG